MAVRTVLTGILVPSLAVALACSSAGSRSPSELAPRVRCPDNRVVVVSNNLNVPMDVWDQSFRSPQLLGTVDARSTVSFPLDPRSREAIRVTLPRRNEGYRLAGPPFSIRDQVRTRIDCGG